MTEKIAIDMDEFFSASVLLPPDFGRALAIDLLFALLQGCLPIAELKLNISPSLTIVTWLLRIQKKRIPGLTWQISDAFCTLPAKFPDTITERPAFILPLRVKSVDNYSILQLAGYNKFYQLFWLRALLYEQC